MKLKQVNVRFPAEWVDLIEKEAAEDNVNVSDVIRQAVLAWWEKRLSNKHGFKINVSDLHGDSLIKLKFLADAYLSNKGSLKDVLSKRGMEFKDVESIEWKDDLLMYTLKKT